MSIQYSIGWDVGAWNCKGGSKSSDAIVILGSDLHIVGKPWRGNLRGCVAEATTTRHWLFELFRLCEAPFPKESFKVAMAIDTPLGFSDEFVRLITRQGFTEPHAESGMNQYLYRYTERHLLNRLVSVRRLKPLSAIKDMIGSQATKGLHTLAKFAPHVESCGVWTDGHGFHAIEAYPSACRESSIVKNLRKNQGEVNPQDEEDALICALVAHLFVTDREALESPPEEVPVGEGWIWTTKEAPKA